MGCHVNISVLLIAVRLAVQSRNASPIKACARGTSSSSCLSLANVSLAHLDRENLRLGTWILCLLVNCVRALRSLLFLLVGGRLFAPERMNQVGQQWAQIKDTIETSRRAHNARNAKKSIEKTLLLTLNASKMWNTEYRYHFECDLTHGVTSQSIIRQKTQR